MLFSVRENYSIRGPPAVSQLFVAVADVSHCSTAVPSDVSHCSTAVSSDVSHCSTAVPSDVSHCSTAVPSDVSHCSTAVPSDVSRELSAGVEIPRLYIVFLGK